MKYISIWYIITLNIWFRRSFVMWTSVYMTQNIDTARAMREKMESANIIVMLRGIKLEDMAGEECYELLVPGAELKSALDIIIEE